MSIGAGDRNRRVTFERATITRDTLGVEVEAWAAIGRAWAAVRFGTGAERRGAAMEAASQPATFIVLASSTARGLTARDRISFDGKVWGIVATMRTADRSHMEITATARIG